MARTRRSSFLSGEADADAYAYVGNQTSFDLRFARIADRIWRSRIARARSLAVMIAVLRET